MPFKPGGGDRLQYYNDDNGQYSDNQKAEFAKIDKENLVLFHYFGLEYSHLVFHFPKFNYHDEEYCEIFVLYAKEKIKGLKSDSNKAKYFLRCEKNIDKSTFFRSLGYSDKNEDELINDIIKGTDIKTLEYSRINSYGLMVSAKTKIREKLVTSVWELQPNLVLRLVTIIPGGDKRWNSK